MTAVAADFRELRDLAARLARQAGDAVADRRRSGPLAALTKSSPTDMVTELDHLSESLIVEGLTAERPGDAIVGEEGTARSGTTGVVWLVDPVDGTTNLLYGLPEWSVSIAATFAGATVAGVVYAPMLGELYSAVAGDGASRDGQPIRCSTTVEVASALVATGFSYLAPRRVAQGAAVAALLPRVRDIRRLGSAALDLCFVAGGRVDGYFERGLNPWDLAAGELIAREAGATTTDFAGGSASTSDVVAAPPQLHPALLTLLQEAGA